MGIKTDHFTTYKAKLSYLALLSKKDDRRTKWTCYTEKLFSMHLPAGCENCFSKHLAGLVFVIGSFLPL